jgi:hypothetical protein
MSAGAFENRATERVYRWLADNEPLRARVLAEIEARRQEGMGAEDALAAQLEGAEGIGTPWLDDALAGESADEVNVPQLLAALRDLPRAGERP